MNRVPLAILLVAVAITSEACDKRAERPRTWQAADHDQPDEAQTALVPPGNQRVELNAPKTVITEQPSANNDAARQSPHPMDGMPGSSALRLWATQCMGCHGQIGAGDGAQAPRGKDLDLTSITWQRSVTDEQIAQSIQRGKGQMPAFSIEPNLMEPLVALIRRMAAVQQGAAPNASIEAPTDGPSPRARNPNQNLP